MSDLSDALVGGNSDQNFDPFALSPIIPVVKIENLKHALPVAEALLEGGIPVIEITLRSACALQAMECVAKELPEMKVGAGTIINPQQLQQCIDVGALFGLSPGASIPLLEKAHSVDWPFIPGVATATDIINSIDYGFDALKFFPAEANGGCNSIKSFAGPFPDVRFCPTGGVGLTNLNDYLNLDNVTCVGGTWITPGKDIKQSKWHVITTLCQEALSRCLTS